MACKRWSHGIVSRFAFGIFLLLLISAFPAATAQAQANEQQVQAPSEAAAENQPVIRSAAQLPDTYPRGGYNVRLVATGGVPTLHWRLEKGTLPPGIQLQTDGLLRGSAERQGDFQFTLSVHDSDNPAHSVQKEFSIRVRAALTLNWKSPAHVNGNRIEGSVNVSNTTPDDIDLTFIVLAVADNGRATAIGYQHFSLSPRTNEMELPFGETLPTGGYVVNVDVVGEVAPKNVIYRERMQTPRPLQVTVGP